MDIPLRQTSAGTKKVSVLERVDCISFTASLTGTSFLATRSNSRTGTHHVWYAVISKSRLKCLKKK